jgi:hypothetical protein
MKITDAYIVKITNGILGAVETAENGRGAYLRALIEGAQDALGAKGQPLPVQVAALATTHERFYALVLDTVSQAVPRALKDRAIEVHRRANFARTALSAVRRYVKAGNDLASIKADRATKRSLAVEREPAVLTVKRVLATIERETRTLLTNLTALAEMDRQAAFDEITKAIAELDHELLTLAPRIAPQRATLLKKKHAPAVAPEVMLKQMQEQPRSYVGAAAH